MKKVQDVVDVWVKEGRQKKLLSDYKAGKKIFLGKTHTQELSD